MIKMAWSSMAMAHRQASYLFNMRHTNLNPLLCHTRAVASSVASEWTGLQAWRISPVDERRIWKHGPRRRQEDVVKEHVYATPSNCPSSLAEWGALVLNTPDPALKATITHHAFRLWSQGDLPIGVAQAPHLPARPPKPELVPVKQVPSPTGSPLPLNAHILHNLAHIELNAVDLAWDTVVRFSEAHGELDHQFFADFARVADDESRHFSWCSQRLAELGFQYGDMPAHNVLVNECHKTSNSVMARLVVIPMVQEARGLDAGPRLSSRLVGMGDNRSAGIVNQIAEEELAHVAVGVSWFLSVCKKMGRVPDSTFKDLLQECNVELKGPFNHFARAKAGIPQHWYDSLAPSAARNNRKSPMKADDDKTAARQSLHVVESFDLKGSQVVTTNMDEKIGVEFSNSPISSKNATLDSSQSSKVAASCLPEVYERLALLVEMEKQNTGA